MTATAKFQQWISFSSWNVSSLVNLKGAPWQQLLCCGRIFPQCTICREKKHVFPPSLSSTIIPKVCNLINVTTVFRIIQCDFNLTTKPWVLKQWWKFSYKPFLMYWANCQVSRSPCAAAIFFPGLLWVQMSHASWQLHLWMINLTNRPVFKCICSKEAVAFQIGTLWAADIFAGMESSKNTK